MQFFNDRTATMYITSLDVEQHKIPELCKKTPSRTSCKTAPPVLMEQGICKGYNREYAFFDAVRDYGYNYARDHSFIKNGVITCSDQNRQVQPGLLYYCLTGQADYYMHLSPNDPCFIQGSIHSSVALNYRPSPDDLPWKPYLIVFGQKSFHVYFMALNADNEVLTVELSCEKLAFNIEFHICFPKTNQYESYICTWSPIPHPGSRIPFSVLYELYLNAIPFSCGIAHRTIRYESYPGLVPGSTVRNLRVFGDEVKIIEQDAPN